MLHHAWFVFSITLMQLFCITNISFKKYFYLLFIGRQGQKDENIVAGSIPPLSVKKYFF